MIIFSGLLCLLLIISFRLLIAFIIADKNKNNPLMIFSKRLKNYFFSGYLLSHNEDSFIDDRSMNQA